jgi:hypothetical protein
MPPSQPWSYILKIYSVEAIWEIQSTISSANSEWPSLTWWVASSLIAAFRLFQSLFVLGNRLPIDCLSRSDDDVTCNGKAEGNAKLITLHRVSAEVVIECC